VTFLTSSYRRLRRLARELAKFGSVGALAFILTFGLFNLFREVFHWGPLTSNGVATVISATFAYFGNRYWTFRHREKSGMGREYVLFFILNAIGLAITQLFLGSAHYLLGLTGSLAENGTLVVGTGCATVFRYYAYKRWVFLAPAEPQAPQAPQVAAVVAGRLPEASARPYETVPFSELLH
jgi:putative flippase GtrA